MRFTPQSEQQVQESSNKFGPWRNGIYDFEIAEAEEKQSKAGNDMLVLTLHVYNRDGERRVIYDYLLESIPHKLRHAAAGCGLMAEYHRGQLSSVDFYGKTGRLKLGLQPEKDGFPAKNVVRDYLTAPSVHTAEPPPPPSARKPVPAGAGSDLDDEIPF